MALDVFAAVFDAHVLSFQVGTHYDTTALDLYYQAGPVVDDAGDEEDEEDYMDEDQREMQKRGIKGMLKYGCRLFQTASNTHLSVLVAGMKPSHVAAKPQGRQSAGKYSKAKQASQASPVPSTTPPQNKSAAVVAPSPSRTPTKLAQTPPKQKSTEGSPFEQPLDEEDDNSDASDDDVVPAGPQVSLRQGGGPSRKQKKEEKLETLNPTSGTVLDGRTRLKLQKIVNEGLIDTIGGVLAVGKEASVFHAEKDNGDKEIAVKIFKTTLAEFRDREQYLLGEWRFRHETTKQLSTHKLIKLWAEKEIRNLKRLRASSVPVPEPIALKGHIVLMEFIGSKTRPAPQLAKLRFPGDSPSDGTNVPRIFPEP